MIQELLGGSTLIAAERKTTFTNASGPLLSPSTGTTPSSTATTNTPTSATSSNSSENQNLRCPRCDSSNTKFCYYNNYNLTQPRHFCKTCRRYWTKGGALRNVPIGGGCRKNKSVGGSVSSSAAGKTSAATKMKTVASELGRSSSSSGLGPGFDHLELPSGPILWGSPQNTHLLALLRASSQDQNPNPNPSSMSLISAVTVKEEGNNNLIVPQALHIVTDPLVVSNPPGALGYDSLGQVPSLGLCSSLWINNQDHDQTQQTNAGFLHGENQARGIQELYHMMRTSSSSANYDGSENNSPVFLGSMASASYSSMSNILESTSVSGAELGYWNPTLSWSDIPTTTNGAYP